MNGIDLSEHAVQWTDQVLKPTDFTLYSTTELQERLKILHTIGTVLFQD